VVIGEWRKLHKEELNELHSSPNIVQVIKSTRIRWAWHVASMEERRSLYRGLAGRPLGRSRCRWEDNIKIYLQKVGCGDMDWIKLAQDGERWQTLVIAVMDLWFP
jgi:hypothetical protein